ncbi:MAG: peptidoglycan DD-metalloendopeptidase family protein [Bdellovibrionales bacterium]
MKDRYIRKRDGSLRVRCKAALTVSVVTLSLMTGVQAYESYLGVNFDMNYAEKLIASDSFKTDIQLASGEASKNGDETLYLASLQPPSTDILDVEVPDDTNTFLHNYTRIREALSDEREIKEKFAPRDVKVTIKKGDTLAGALQRNGVSGGDAYTVVKSLSEHFDPRLIRPGQNVKLTIAPYNGEMAFSRMDLITDPIRTVVVERDSDGVISSQLMQKEIMPQMYAAKATIENSLYGSAMKQGVPEPIIAQAIRVLSWSIDFQREIRAGDELQVLYDVYMTDSGEYVRSGEPYYIRLTQANNELALYLHELPDGRTGYFRENGHSAKKGLLRTLVDGARISSGYGMRKHPVLGYGKMHKGIDFAAPRGTPVYAAGDGVVKKASRFSSFGNYIKIRHNNNLETAYAHLQGYAKGVKAGARVKQGQVIGYVGTTGRSTGPHLHYEVLVNGKQANPRSVKVPTGEILTGSKLAELQKTIRKYDRQFASLLDSQKVASRSENKANNVN